MPEVSRSEPVHTSQTPSQNNANLDDSIDSVQSIILPDLSEILATFNKKKKQHDDVDDCTINDPSVREFGQTFCHFNLTRSDGTVFKPEKKLKQKVKKTNRLSEFPSENKSRIVKPRIPRAPRVKAAKKKNVTITGRAISEFDPACLPAFSSSRPVDQHITKFMTPNKPACATKNIVPKKRRAMRKKVRLEFSIVPLMLPRQASCMFRRQILFYRKLPSSERPLPAPLPPSSLISLSKGHWYAGNRSPDGLLTDGGPDQFWPNQEKEYDPWQLSQEEASHPRDISFEQVESLAFQIDEMDYAQFSSISEETREHNLDGYLGSLGTQAYLRELVGVSGEMSSDGDADADFPVEISVPVLLHLESSTTLLDALRTEQSLSEDDSNCIIINKESVLKRQLVEEVELERNVVHKISSLSSPRSELTIIPVEDFPGVAKHESPSLVHNTTVKLPESHQVCNGPIVVSEIANVRAEQMSQETQQIVITLETSDEEPSEPSVIMDPFSVRKLDQHTCDLELHEVTRKTALHECFTQLRSTWVVPDSEDDSDESTEAVPLASLQRRHLCEATLNKAAPEKSSRSVAPNFNGYTTPQLQSELSNYGFKVSKNREGMVGLLNKCWRAKSHMTMPSQSRANLSTKTTGSTAAEDVILDLTTDSSSQIPQSTSAKTLKSISRLEEAARKAELKRMTAEQKTLEMLANKAAKKEKRLAEQESKKAQKLADSEAKKARKLADKEAEVQAKLQSTLQLSHDLTRLLKSEAGHVWWLRILSYEPIVLEDFIDWLKSNRSIETDVDTIRDYFDSQGVCCVRKVTRQGKDRKRF